MIEGVSLTPAVSPKVIAIVNELANRIADGRYADGDWFPTERELVEEFGVSRTVIRQAVEELEQRSLIVRSPRHRTLVQRACSPPSAPSPTARQTLALWIWPSPDDPTCLSLVNGIYQVLDHSAFRLVVGHAYGENWKAVLQSEAHFLEQIARDKDIAGVILWYLGGEQNLPALLALRAQNIPVIFIDRRPPAGFEADYIGTDNEHAAEMVVRHLIVLGHRRIAHVTNLDQASTVRERMAGYQRALASAGLLSRPEWIVTQREPRTTGETQQQVFEQLATQLLELPEAPTAVFAVNDISALRLVDALRALNVRVPEDVSVAGFDGVGRWLPNASFLTTADQPFQRIGARAVERLVLRLQSDTSAACQHILLEAPLAVRASTGRPPRTGTQTAAGPPSFPAQTDA